MPFTDDQHEYPLPTGGKIPPRRKSAELLPRYFRTITNKKFLNATLDQLTQPGVAEKLAGYSHCQTDSVSHPLALTEPSWFILISL